MNNLLMLLSVYYHCDVAAEHARLNVQQYVMCAEVYQLVQTEFLTEDEKVIASQMVPTERGPLLVNGYNAFKVWEGENAEIVATMREVASEAILGQVS